MHNSPQGSIKLLVLSASPLDEELFEREFRRAGISFVASRVETLVALTQALAEAPPDVILIHCEHYACDGTKAMGLIRHKHPEIPIILIADSLADNEILSWIDAGAKDYVLASQLTKLPLSVLHVLTVEQGIRARKAAEQAIRESNELFQSISMAANDAIMMLDSDGKISYWNPAAEKMFGYAVDEALGKELHPFLAPSRFLDAYRRNFPHFRNAGEGWVIGKTLELFAIRKNGDEFPIELSVSALTIKGRWHAVGIMRDMSERKRHLDELRASNDLLQSIVENAPVRVFWKDKESRYLGCNTSFARDAGMSHPDELLGKDDFQMGWRDQASLYRADDKLVMDSDTAKIGYEEPQTTPEGSTIWLRTSKVPLKNAEGKVIGILGIYDDITEFKENQIRLQTSLEALEEAQQLAHIGSWSWVVPTDTIAWSAEYYVIYNNDPAQPTPSYVEHLNVYTAESAQRLDAAVKRAVELGEPYKLELQLNKPGVEGKWVLARGSAKRDQNGKVVELHGTAQDITERKQAELLQKKLTRALTVLSNSNKVLIYAENEHDLLSEICKVIVESGGYALAWVGFPENDPNKRVRAVAHSGRDGGYLDSVNISWADNERGSGPTGTAIRTGTLQINQNFKTNITLTPWRKVALDRGFQSSIAIPLTSAGNVLGALSIYADEPDAFGSDESALLEELASDLAFGLSSLRIRDERNLAVQEREEYAEKLRNSLESALQAIATTLEMRDPYTAGHQRRVADLGGKIARELALTAEQIHGIRLAGTVHDLGKIHIPAEILSKPGRLTEIEFALVKTHSQAGYDILKAIQFPWPIAQTVLQHHERLDGSGYPLGLKGGQITLEAKILAVADTVEAMTSHRPYRPGLGCDAALQEIRKGRGRLYDEKVVDACLKLFESGYQLPEV